MWARAPWMVLPCGSTTAFFGVTIIFAFMLISRSRSRWAAWCGNCLTGASFFAPARRAGGQPGRIAGANFRAASGTGRALRNGDAVEFMGPADRILEPENAVQILHEAQLCPGNKI